MTARAAFLLALLGALLGTITPAFAQPVFERRLAWSAPWQSWDVALQPQTRYRLVVRDLTATCTDPLNRPVSQCLEATSGAADLIVHLLGDDGREIVTPPLRCPDGECDREFGVLAATPRVHLMVHGGPAADGVVRGRVQLTLANGEVVRQFDPIVAGNVMVNLQQLPTGRVSIHSVLVPDGPERLRNGQTTSGNVLNDQLGVAATEMWILAPDFSFRRADLAFSGVGTAAFMQALGGFHASNNGLAWALVRPWEPTAVTIDLPGEDGAAREQVRYPEERPESRMPGRMRVIANAGVDTDRDGASDAVERVYGTCDGLHAIVATRPSSLNLIDPDANPREYRCATVAYNNAHPGAVLTDPRRAALPKSLEFS